MFRRSPPRATTMTWHGVWLMPIVFLVSAPVGMSQLGEDGIKNGGDDWKHMMLSLDEQNNFFRRISGITQGAFRGKTLGELHDKLIEVAGIYKMEMQTKANIWTALGKVSWRDARIGEEEHINRKILERMLQTIDPYFFDYAIEHLPLFEGSGQISYSVPFAFTGDSATSSIARRLPEEQRLVVFVNAVQLWASMNQDKHTLGVLFDILWEIEWDSEPRMRIMSELFDKWPIQTIDSVRRLLPGKDEPSDAACTSGSGGSTKWRYQKMFSEREKVGFNQHLKTIVSETRSRKFGYTYGELNKVAQLLKKGMPSVFA